MKTIRKSFMKQIIKLKLLLILIVFNYNLILLINGREIQHQQQHQQQQQEHKLHNIVLYPDKHSWCSALNIKQVISYPGCESKEINNTVCVGACFSYAIPNVEPSDPGEIILPYCDSCQPSDTTWTYVTLECDQNFHNDGQIAHTKHIEIINNCACNSCHKQQDIILNQPLSKNMNINYYKDIKENHTNFINDNNIDQHNDGNDNIDKLIDLVTDDDSEDEDVNDAPDILTAFQFHNDTNVTTATATPTDENQQHPHHPHQHQHHQQKSAETAENLHNLKKHKIIRLIQRIQEKNLQLDKVELMKILSLIRSDENGHDINNNDKVIANFVESLNSENIEVDVSKLKELLKKIEHTNFMQDNDYSTGDHQYHHHHYHHRRNHNHLHPPAHHTGELFGNGHLIKGPHGSLIIEHDSDATQPQHPQQHDEHMKQHHHHYHDHKRKPYNFDNNDSNDNISVDVDVDDDDNINNNNKHEKLEVNPNDLKLNHAGAMLWYGNFNDISESNDKNVNDLLDEHHRNQQHHNHHHHHHHLYHHQIHDNNITNDENENQKFI